MHGPFLQASPRRRHSLRNLPCTLPSSWHGCRRPVPYSSAEYTSKVQGRPSGAILIARMSGWVKSRMAWLQAAEEMLQESGLQELEQRVLGFLCTNSGGLKLLSTLDDAQRLLHQVEAAARPVACQAASVAAPCWPSIQQLQLLRLS